MKRILVILSIALLTLGMNACCRPCRKAKPIEVKGSQWGLLELNDKVIDRESKQYADRLTLILGQEGRLSGRGDCNGFFGSYTLVDDKITINGIASTRMLCPNQALEDEYFRTLEKAKQMKIDGDFLLLMDEDGKIRISFQKLSE